MLDRHSARADWSEPLHRCGARADRESRVGLRGASPPPAAHRGTVAPRGAIDPHAREQASRRGPPAEIEAMLDAVPALTALRSPPDPAVLADLFETFDVTQSEPLQTARLQITPELVPAQENPTAARWRKSSVAGTGS